MRQLTAHQRSKGFSLVETMIAMLVLIGGLLSLAYTLGNSIAFMQGAQMDFIAQQKAQQAVEAIFTAKYTNAVTWAQISNNTGANPGGLFLTGPQPLLQPGPDGLLGSVNDVGAPPDFILDPGPDGKLGTVDDIQKPLSNFTRTITITGVAANANLRNIQVQVTYRIAGNLTRTYTLNSLISAFN